MLPASGGRERRAYLHPYISILPPIISWHTIPIILGDADNNLTLGFREIVQELYNELLRSFERVGDYDKKLQAIYRSNEDCKRLSKIDGVGFITATALVAAVGDPKAFKNGREFSAWLGLTPRQHSTGGKTTLLGISKRGDRYLRKNLIHGCRIVVYYAQNKEDKRSRWVKEKLPAKGVNKMSVALANKTARAIWVVLARKEEYRRAA